MRAERHEGIDSLMTSGVDIGHSEDVGSSIAGFLVAEENRAARGSCAYAVSRDVGRAVGRTA